MKHFFHNLGIAVIALLFANLNNSNSQIFQAGADTVLKFTPGIGNSHGQNPPYFPNNVLGLPSTFGNEFAAETREEEICALNFGGEIIIGFKIAVIVDQTGPDFTVFENAFKSSFAPYVFAEPAKIAVSRDGITFKEFPYDSLTLKGCAGISPTYGKNNPFDPAVSGGDAFDLAEIGIDSVRFIKISDITIDLKPGHPFYQPTLTGFDLDAVVGLHLVKLKDEATMQKISIQQISSELIIQTDDELLKNAKCEIFALNGSSLYAGNLSGGVLKTTLDPFPHGIFIAVLKEKELSTSQKFIIK